MWNLLKISGAMIFAILLAVPASAQDHKHDHSQHAGLMRYDDPPDVELYGPPENPELHSELTTILSREAAQKLACELMVKEQRDGTGAPFSFWGHEHFRAHCMGWIDELMKLKGGSCCHGVYSGECRISVVNLETRMVMIDGNWCPIGGVDPLVVPNMGAFTLVCANKKPFLAGSCPSIHCIGVGGGT